MHPREAGQGQDAELEAAPGGARARVEDDLAPLAGIGEGITAGIGAKVKVVARHAELCRQLLAQPATGGDAVKAEAVGVLRQQELGSHRMEAGLVVLDEVELSRLGLGDRHRVGRLPGGGDKGIATVTLRPPVEDLGSNRREVAPDHPRRLRRRLDVPPVVDDQPATMSQPFEQLDHPQDRAVPTRAPVDRRDQPLDRHRPGKDPAVVAVVGTGRAPVDRQHVVECNRKLEPLLAREPAAHVPRGPPPQDEGPVLAQDSRRLADHSQKTAAAAVDFHAGRASPPRWDPFV
jgi:hypothetical protein